MLTALNCTPARLLAANMREVPPVLVQLLLPLLLVLA
jgi:hypothetical protein